MFAWERLFAGLVAVAACAGAATPAAAGDRRSVQTTTAITSGNGPSTHPVVSQDRRYARAVAFQSAATDLVPGDTNGVTDIFMVRREGRADNVGTPWRPGPVELVSRAFDGSVANGPSWGAAIDGGFPHRRRRPTHPKCVAFLSDASNLVQGDTNGVTDAFVSLGPGRRIERVSLPGGSQTTSPTTAVTVSVDCSHIAYVTAGELHVRHRGRDRTINLPGPAADPSFATGARDDLVVGAARGVYRLKNGTGRPLLVAPGGRNPAYNDVKCRVVVYEVTDAAGRSQVAWRFLGNAPRSERRRRSSGVGCHALDRDGEQFASKNTRNLGLGNGDSRNPSIGNSGYYMTFESDATNLGSTASGQAEDTNGKRDVYLYTAVRNLTLVQSVDKKADPRGGANPSTSWYANYVFFDTSQWNDPTLPPWLGGRYVQQIFLRYLGPV